MKRHWVVAVSCFGVAVVGVDCTTTQRAGKAGAMVRPSPDPSAAVGPAPSTTPQFVPASTVEPDAGPMRKGPITSPCVLHGSYADVHKRRTAAVAGATSTETLSAVCSADAECMEHKGQPNDGDGFVSVACKGLTCTCKLEPLGPGSKLVESEFELREPCTTTTRATQLMIEHCMQGIVVLGEH